jgi:hypothetical protein
VPYLAGSDGFYNPFAVVDHATNAVVETIDQLVEAIAAGNRSSFANPFVPFNLASP